MNKNNLLSFAEGNLIYLSEEIQKEFTSIIKKVKKIIESESIWEAELKEALDFIERSTAYILDAKWKTSKQRRDITIVAGNYRLVVEKMIS